MDVRIIVPQDDEHAPFWRGLLRNWVEMIEFYATLSERGEIDVPYWYGERALTGLLAAAAWKLEGGWALEEFSAERGGDEGSGRGRGDLWYGMGDVKITIEAKTHWPETDKESEIEKIETRLASARGQLQTLENDYRYGDPYSVCYVVPWPRKEDYESASREGYFFLDRLAEELASKSRIIAKWAIESDPPEYEGRVYPGVLLVARREEW